MNIISDHDACEIEIIVRGSPFMHTCALQYSDGCTRITNETTEQEKVNEQHIGNIINIHIQTINHFIPNSQSQQYVSCFPLRLFIGCYKFQNIVHDNRLHYISLVCNIGMKGLFIKVCYLVFVITRSRCHNFIHGNELPGILHHMIQMS